MGVEERQREDEGISKSWGGAGPHDGSLQGDSRERGCGRGVRKEGSSRSGGGWKALGRSQQGVGKGEGRASTGARRDARMGRARNDGEFGRFGRGR